MPGEETQRLKRCLDRKVRLVMARGGEPAEALIEIAVKQQPGWGYAEWRVALDKLDSCDETVGEWLAGREQQPQQEVTEDTMLVPAETLQAEPFQLVMA